MHLWLGNYKWAWKIGYSIPFFFPFDVFLKLQFRPLVSVWLQNGGVYNCID